MPLLHLARRPWDGVRSIQKGLGEEVAPKGRQKAPVPRAGLPFRKGEQPGRGAFRGDPVVGHLPAPRPSPPGVTARRVRQLHPKEG